MENRPFKILVADDDERIRILLCEMLRENGYTVCQASDGYQVVELIKNQSPDLILLDLKMPGMDGLDVLHTAKKLLEDTIVIVITAHGTIQNAIEATRLGVYDFVEKPIKEDRILMMVENALKARTLEKENIRLKHELLHGFKLIGVSSALQSINRFINRAAETDASVLITGNNGTGKDLVARNIHIQSRRNQANFVNVNCAAIPTHLMESELFGHERGAFTGAGKMTQGKFEIAHGGTILLNEIGELTPDMQAKLLHVLESKEIERLGSTRSVKIDVRVLAATNVNFEDDIKNGRFRKDLFYRLNVLHLHLPDLKDRTEDILPLFEYFMKHICDQQGLNLKTLTSESKNILKNYDWPGNIRQLKNIVTNLAIMTTEEEIKPQKLKPLLQKDNHFLKQAELEKDTYSLIRARQKFERNYILHQLEENQWNVRRTSEVLEIDRTHLYKLIQKYNLKV